MTRFFTLLFILNLTLSFSQGFKIDNNTQISILTIGAGNSLPEAFGHSGIRVKNNTFDLVFDYGNYPFHEPNFILNYTLGKLNYHIAYRKYSNLINYYKTHDRNVKEQVLNLTELEKEAFLTILTENIKPENRKYLYDFFYDNCATKIRDVTEKIVSKNIEYKTSKTYKIKTFRTLIQDNLHWNTWGSLGIDIALGAVIDKNATPKEHMFLPENIHIFFNNAVRKNTNKPIVKSSKTVYETANKKYVQPFLASPFFILSIVSLFIIFITYRDYKNKTRTKWLDVSILLITGLFGVFILFLWLGTDHTATANNYNTLWAFPFSIFAVLQARKTTPKPWFKKFIKLLIIILCLMILHWLIGIQRFAFALIPLIIALFLRYIYLIAILREKI